MKQIIIIATVLFSVFANQASALSIMPTDYLRDRARITEFDMEQEWLQDVIAGNVVINHTKQTITLTLIDGNSVKNDCPVGFACINPPHPISHVINLPIVNQYTGFCGSHHYVAEIDRTPVDGLKETLVVVDNSSITCKIKMEHMTDIEYITLNPWSQESAHSVMGAERLVSQPRFY